ncbi:hypothetical protein D3C77_453750 [compost metagenome]
MQVALHPAQGRGVEVAGERLVGGLHPADGVIHRHQRTLVVARARLHEQPRQRPAHDPDGLAPGLRFGVARVHRQNRLLLAQLDDRVTDLKHHEHPAQQLALHPRLADRQAIGLVQQVAGAAFEARTQAA